MTTTLRLFATVCLLTIGWSAAAQPRSGEGIVDRWIAQQRVALAPLVEVHFKESVYRNVEGPFTARSVAVTQEITRASGRVQHRILHAEVDGEEVSAERIEHFHHRLHRGLGRGHDIMAGYAYLPVDFVTHLQPTGLAAREDLDGVRAIRVDMEPRQSDAFVGQVSLWFVREQGQLVLRRSRVEIRTSEPANVVSIMSDYGTIQGPAGPLAVLRAGHSHAEVQQQRRWRTFTVVMSSTRTIDEIRPRWRR